MGEAIIFTCDNPECHKFAPSNWAGPPQGWVRLDGKAYWDGTNYHILEGKKKWVFCSIKCFVEHLKTGNYQQGS